MADYASKPSSPDGAAAPTALTDPSPGKRTLVEQAYRAGPPMQRRSSEADDTGVSVAARRSATPAAGLPHGVFGRRDVSSAQAQADAAGKRYGKTELRSPRFAGDPVLQACRDDKARLTIGATGHPVSAVQQALLDLGYPLAGASGSYDTTTWNAVKQFKAKEQLGWETMGDVGPKTMTRLDELFAPAPPSDDDDRVTADEEGHETALDYIAVRDDDPLAGTGPGVAIGREPPPMPPKTLAEPPATAVELFQSPQPGQPALHMSIPDAVVHYKAIGDVASGLKDSNRNLHDSGQFFWRFQLAHAVRDEIVGLANEPGAGPFAGLAASAFLKIITEDSAAAIAAEIRRLQQMAATATSPAKPRMSALVHGFISGGAAIEDKLFAELDADPSGALPDLTPYRDLLTLRVIVNFDFDACVHYANRITDRLKKKGGFTPRAPRPRGFSAALNSGTGTRDRRPVGGATHRGDVIRQNGVASAAQQAKDALDDGLIVHARVLSGCGLGMGVVPPEPGATVIPLGIPGDGEHTVVIFAYDGDTFVFGDPDAAVSHTPEAGFGQLTFDSGAGRLSTALDDSDMAVDERGYHARGDKRYQVLWLASQ